MNRFIDFSHLQYSHFHLLWFLLTYLYILQLAAKQNFLPTGESELISSLGTPPKIKQSYKRSSQSNLPNRTVNSAKFNQNVNLIPTRRVSLSNSQIRFNEDTDATDCVSTLSGETSQTMEYNEFNKTHHGSDRSAASGRSKSKRTYCYLFSFVVIWIPRFDLFFFLILI